MEALAFDSVLFICNISSDPLLLWTDPSSDAPV
jgi:hypothetical protein